MKREPSSPPFSTFEEKSLPSCLPFYSLTFPVSVWSRSREPRRALRSLLVRPPRALVVPTANKLHRECIAITPVARWICLQAGDRSGCCSTRAIFAASIPSVHARRLALPLPDLLLPHAQRTSRLRESLRQLGEEGGGQAGARMSKQQGMACSASTILRLLRHGPLPPPPSVKVLGVDDWAWRQQSRATERYSSISSVISRSIFCQMPRRTRLPLGSKSILRWS